MTAPRPFQVRLPLQVDTDRLKRKLAHLLESPPNIANHWLRHCVDLNQGQDVLVWFVLADANLAPGNGEGLSASNSALHLDEPDGTVEVLGLDVITLVVWGISTGLRAILRSASMTASTAARSVADRSREY